MPVELTANQLKWLELLERGDLPQTSGMLARADKFGRPTGYCCLGVACVAARADGVPVKIELDNGWEAIAFDGHEGSLPPAVQEWLGVGYENPEVEVARPDGLGMERRSLASLNDSGYSFAQIAAIVRAHGFID